MAQKSFNSSSPVQKEASLESCSPVERTLEVDVSPQRATSSTTTSSTPSSSTPSSSTPSSSRGLFAGVKLGDKPVSALYYVLNSLPSFTFTFFHRDTDVIAVGSFQSLWMVFYSIYEIWVHLFITLYRKHLIVKIHCWQNPDIKTINVFFLLTHVVFVLVLFWTWSYFVKQSSLWNTVIIATCVSAQKKIGFCEQIWVQYTIIYNQLLSVFLEVKCHFEVKLGRPYKLYKMNVN